MKVGFIGNGSMSSALIGSLLDSGKVSSSEIILSGSTSQSSGAAWDQVRVAKENRDVVKEAKYIFVCAEPSETESVLNEIKDCVSPETNIISMDYPASIEAMESTVSCKVTKLAPTMISENGRRVSVICHGRNVRQTEADYIESLLHGVCNAKVYKSKRF